MPISIPMQPEKQHQSIRLFENELLERLSHVHPITPLLMWAPIAGWLIWRSFYQYHLPTLPVVAILIAGAFVWTLSEYCLHRFLFHYPAKSKLGKWLVFLFQGNHHEDPKDKTRLVMPQPALFRLCWCCIFCSACSYRNPGFSRFAAVLSSATWSMTISITPRTTSPCAVRWRSTSNTTT